ncbi:CPBP family intramembrane glutamic endopeptidase [Leucobacter sp. USHLN154]|uniref:CPBP family intramembrane glutamic endopeptidase n=1 Tax=Leucobacter sp. USHLN154 TaxID=3081269 RepID=UPI00301B2063
MIRENLTGPGSQTEPRWGEWVIARSLIILVVGVLVAMLAASAMFSVATATLVSVLPIWAAIVIAVLWAVRKEGSGRLVRDLRLRVRPIDIVIGLLGGVALALIGVVLTAAISGRSPFGGTGIEVVNGGRPLSYWMAALALPLVAAVFEEVFFRGLLQPAFSRVSSGLGVGRGVAATLGIALTTVCFVAFHLVLTPSGGAATAVVLLIVSVACGVVAQLRGTIGSAIATHLVYNYVGSVSLLARWDLMHV